MKSQWIQTSLDFLVLSLAIILLLGITLVPANALERESPFFIDNLQCEGINYPQFLAMFASSDEAKKIINDTTQQDTCERIFEHFGIKKYQWISAQELEQLNMRIKESNYFTESDLALEKSQLKNHIYLQLKVKSRDNWHKALRYASTYSPGNGGNKTRNSSELTFELTSKDSLPLRESTFGFNFYQSSAQNQFTHNNQSLNIMDANVIGSELYFKDRTHYNQYFTGKFRYGLGSITQGQNQGFSKLSINLEYSLLFRSKTLIAESYIGPSIIYQTANLSRSGETKKSIKEVSLLGAESSVLFGNKYKFFKIYSSYHVSTESAYQLFRYEFDMNYPLLPVWGIFMMASNYTRTASSPIDYKEAFYNPEIKDFRQSNFLIGIGKHLKGANGIHQLAMKYGTEELSHKNISKTPVKTDLIKFEYQYLGNSWDWNIGLTFANDRIY